MAGSSPFQGVKVIELSRILASPFAGAQMAFLGADVIKVEDPGSGDHSRTRPSVNMEMMKVGMSTHFLSQNSGKRSITLNLRTPEGQDIFRKLAQDADVIIENLRTGAMDRYGCGYQDIRRINPRIVYCSITAYGQIGPKARHPGYDPVVQAGSGVMSLNGTPETAPVRVGAAVLDFSCGLAAAFAIATALYERERSGEGQHIDAALIDAAFTILGPTAADVLTSGAVPKPQGNQPYDTHPTNASFDTPDGVLYIAAMEPHQVKNLWRAIDRMDIPEDPRYGAGASKDKKWVMALRGELEKTFMTKTAAEWEFILNEAGVPAMRIRTLPQALADPDLNNRGMFHVFDEVPGVEGSVTVPAVPFRLSRSEKAAVNPPPKLGQHTEEILRSIGYSLESQLEVLRQKKVI